MRRFDRQTMLLMLGVLAAGMLLSACSAQVSGMQSPVLHDYGPIEWIPLDRQFDQALISGPGYSAAVENDPRTTPEQYLERHAELPEDARHGDLNRLRVGVRMTDGESGMWQTGARLQILYSDFPETEVTQVSAPIVDVAVDDLPRDGDRVVLTDIDQVESGRAIVLRIIPGTGPDSHRLQLGISPERAPYGGWRATANGEIQRGALVFDTRYERDVDLRDAARVAWRRMTGEGSGFLTAYGILVGVLATTGVVVWRAPGRNGTHGR
jgi:hypothetical protein